MRSRVLFFTSTIQYIKSHQNTQIYTLPIMKFINIILSLATACTALDIYFHDGKSCTTAAAEVCVGMEANVSPPFSSPAPHTKASLRPAARPIKRT
jgi:hypothetical protein